MLTNTKRVFTFAFQDFYRNKGMSLAAIFVLAVVTLLVTGLFFLNGINNYLVATIQNKIDVTAYFVSDATDEDILAVKSDLVGQFPGINKIEYVSKEDALEAFTAKHQDNDVFARALTEVGDNPFLPSLNITTSGDTAQYQQINDVLSHANYSSIIEKVDFSQKKDTIEKVFSITSSVNKLGIGLGILLMLIAVLVVFNTIKLVVDASKEEIATMRIVGASAWFVRAPFIIEGALFGVISFVLCLVLSVLVAWLATGFMSILLPGFSLLGYVGHNFFWLILIQLAAGVGLGVVSSFIVVRSYLKV